MNVAEVRRMTRLERTFYPWILLAALLACKRGEEQKPGSTTAAPATTAPSTAEGSGDKKKTDLSGPKDAKGVDLAKVLGTKEDGWMLPAFAKLKEDMTPAQVGPLLPGGEKIDEYGFADITVTNVTGVAKYRLSYLDDDSKTKRLKFAEIYFDGKLTDEPFWNALVDHLQKKLGAEMTDHGDHHVQWIGPGLTSWSLSKGILHDGYELQTALTK
jgi:hypothetical protein